MNIHMQVAPGYDPPPWLDGWIALVALPCLVVVWYGVPMCIFAVKLSNVMV